MGGESISLERWTEIATLALAEVGSSSLSCETVISGVQLEADLGLCGSLVALVSGEHVTCVGVSSTPDGCRRIAAAMLGMEPADAEELSHDDVRDSIGELVNILAGAIKTKLIVDDPGLTLGLPIFFDGYFEGDSRSRTAYVPCRLGESACVLTLLLAAGSRRNAA